MRFLSKSKDGGPESTVTGYWLVELKKLFSVVLLKFEDGSRDAYHEHAFDSINWVLRGEVEEHEKYWLGDFTTTHRPSLRPVVTHRDTCHKVVSRGTTWVLSLRGPWADTWRELVGGQWRTLTHGRKVVR